MLIRPGKDIENLATKYEPEWKSRLKRNLAHAHFPETAALMDPYVDPVYFRAMVDYLTGSESRLVIENGHFNGLGNLCSDLVRAALVPRHIPDPQSTISGHTLEGLVKLNETAEKGEYTYNPRLGYSFMRRTALNHKLSPEVQDQAATHLTQYSQQTQAELRRVLEEAVQRDDSRAYTSETLVEELFGEVHAVRHLTWKADRLLEATEQPATTRSSQMTIIPGEVRTRLQVEMNRGLDLSLIHI